MFKHMWPWPYQAHFALKYIDELGKFIQAGFPDEPSNGCNPRVVLCCLLCIRLIIGSHAAEFEAFEA